MKTLHRPAATALAVPLLALACGPAGEDPSGRVGGVAQLTEGMEALCAAAPPNLLANGGFEEGLEGWTADAWRPGAVISWDQTWSFAGGASARIAAAVPNDARLIQAVAVEPGAPYRLSGRVRTREVAHSLDGYDVGASLGLHGTWMHTAGITGTRPWTYRSLVFSSGEASEVTVGARLGYWAGSTTGTAWFDQVRLERLRPRQYPSWRFLVLVYGETDFTFTDGAGTTRRVVARMTDEEKRIVARQARLFVGEDLPLLSGGAGAGTVAVRFPDRPLDALSPYGTGWWPSPAETAPERRGLFDSVFVVWDPRGRDAATGEPVWLGGAGGLTPYTGTEQTYSAIVVDMLVVWGDSRNVFKHEFGHSLLWFFEALGLTPSPTVDNHAGPDSYVHCPTGEGYVWVDETLANPIPNSIYNDWSGFTHDYYSGTTAQPSDPARCLGIGSAAWAYGGPATVQGLAWSLDPDERVTRLMGQVEELVDAGVLAPWRAESLEQKLQAAEDALDEGRPAAAIRRLQAFATQVWTFVQYGHLAPRLGGGLAEEALDVVAQICG